MDQERQVASGGGKPGALTLKRVYTTATVCSSVARQTSWAGWTPGWPWADHTANGAWVFMLFPAEDSGVLVAFSMRTMRATVVDGRLAVQQGGDGLEHGIPCDRTFAHAGSVRAATDSHEWALSASLRDPVVLTGTSASLSP